MKSAKQLSPPTPVLSYPKLMESKQTGSIYLMTGDKKGICVFQPKHGSKVGFNNACLCMDVLHDYVGSIILEN